MTKYENFKSNLCKIIEEISKKYTGIVFLSKPQFDKNSRLVNVLYAKYRESTIIQVLPDYSFHIAKSCCVSNYSGSYKVYAGYLYRHSPKQDYNKMSGEILSNLKHLIDSFNDKERELKEKMIIDRLNKMNEDFNG